MWDDRDWTMALKADNPVTQYREFKTAERDVQNAEPIDDLPNKDWLRST